MVQVVAGAAGSTVDPSTAMNATALSLRMMDCLDQASWRTDCRFAYGTVLRSPGGSPSRPGNAATVLRAVGRPAHRFSSLPAAFFSPEEAPVPVSLMSRTELPELPSSMLHVPPMLYFFPLLLTDTDQPEMEPS